MQYVSLALIDCCTTYIALMLYWSVGYCN